MNVVLASDPTLSYVNWTNRIIRCDICQYVLFSLKKNRTFTTVFNTVTFS